MVYMSKNQKEVIKPKPKKNRCDMCDKKYGLIPFECKCGGTFCKTHRYTFMQYCGFDHTSLERERLKVYLPKIIKDKVNNRI